MKPAQFLLTAVVRLYQWTLSPAQKLLFGPHAGCRFTPSCSEYAVDAIRSRGAVAGSWLALKRICRCHPWGDCGHDPVPPAKPTTGDRLCDAHAVDSCIVAAPQTQNR